MAKIDFFFVLNSKVYQFRGYGYDIHNIIYLLNFRLVIKITKNISLEYMFLFSIWTENGRNIREQKSIYLFIIFFQNKQSIHLDLVALFDIHIYTNKQITFWNHLELRDSLFLFRTIFLNLCFSIFAHTKAPKKKWGGVDLFKMDALHNNNTVSNNICLLFTQQSAGGTVSHSVSQPVCWL